MKDGKKATIGERVAYSTAGCIDCPMCSGKGAIRIGPFLRSPNPLTLKVGTLRKRGLTFREIMRATGIKSTSHVAFHLHRYRKERKRIERLTS